MLTPFVVLLLGLWWRAEQRAHQCWIEDPARPWNVQAQLQREQLAWQKSQLVGRRL